MVLIPEKENTTENAIESVEKVSVNRPYLGMSGIGNECVRALWMGFRWCTQETIPARVRRIFERGDLEEARIIRDLKSVGMEVYRWEGDEKIELFGTPGEKQQEIIGFAGHAKGHTDGEVLGVIEAPKTPHLLEMKTMADKYFQKLLKLGVKESNPVYYSQCQRYMGGRKLKRTLLVVTNKNDETRKYIRIKFDQNHYDKLIEKERNVILSEFIPRKEFKQTWYLCRFCKHRYGCHHGAEILKSCRTCKFSDLGNDGEWSCSRQDDKILTVDDQRAACEVYQLGIEGE